MPGAKELHRRDDVASAMLGGEEGLKPEERPGLSFFEALQNTVKAIVGTGVLALPHAFQLSGGIYGPIVVTCIAMYTMNINLILTECHEMRPTRATYSGLCESILGRSGKYIGGLNLILMQIVVCAAHFTFMGRNLTSALQAWGFDVTLEWVLVVCGIGVSGFTLLKDITILKNTSLLGNVAILISLTSILAYALPSFSTTNIKLTSTVPDMMVFVSICIYMFNGIGEVLPISTSMKDRTQYPRVLIASFGILVTAYLIFGLLTSMSFGAETKGLVFDNLDGPVVAIVKIFHALAVFCTVPLKYFSAINDGLVPLMDDCCPGECGPLRTIVRVAMVALSISIAAFVPDFAFLVALVGGFCIAIVAFVLPPLMLQILALEPHSKISARRQVINGLMVVAGVVMCAYMTTKNICDKFFPAA